MRRDSTLALDELTTTTSYMPGAIKKKKKEQENEINGMMKPYGRLRSHREDMCKWTLKYRCLRGTGVNYFCLSVRARYNNALTRLGTAS